jgi:hypothetical protein
VLAGVAAAKTVRIHLGEQERGGCLRRSVQVKVALIYPYLVGYLLRDAGASSEARSFYRGIPLLCHERSRAGCGWVRVGRSAEAGSGQRRGNFAQVNRLTGDRAGNEQPRLRIKNVASNNGVGLGEGDAVTAALNDFIAKQYSRRKT